MGLPSWEDCCLVTLPRLPPQLLALSALLPGLEDLHLCGNNISTLEPPGEQQLRNLQVMNQVVVMHTCMHTHTLSLSPRRC